VLIILGLGFSVNYSIRKKNEQLLLEERFNFLIENDKADESSHLNGCIKEKASSAKNKKIDLSKDKIQSILNKLSEFERKKEFLSPNIKQIDFAKRLDTNTTYLSKVINQYKGKNFSQYLNDLRIDYTLDKLRDDKKFRKYTIKAISEEVGFSNTESFAKAFYNKTGLQPSYYIKKMTDNENITN